MGLLGNASFRAVLCLRQGDDGASTSHRTHRSSGSVDGHGGFRTGLEPISEGLFQVRRASMECVCHSCGLACLPSAQQSIKVFIHSWECKGASAKLMEAHRRMLFAAGPHAERVLQDARNDGSCLEESPAPQNAHVQEAIHASLDLSQQAQPSSRQHAAMRDGSAFADPDFQESVSRALDAGMAEPAKPQPIPKVPHTVHASSHIARCHGLDGEAQAIWEAASRALDAGMAEPVKSMLMVEMLMKITCLP